VSSTPSRPPPPPPGPRLARELLWNLGLLTVAALSLAIGTALVAQALRPRFALVVLLALIVADLAILFVFGRYLIGRLVLGPMRALTDAADAIAGGDLTVRAPAAETEEFARLADHLNEMTESLLDVQSQLVRAEKLAGIGRLAAGVAHEIGNPLAAIGTYVEVLRRRQAAPDLADDLAREAERIDQIVRGLLAYARSEEAEAGSLDVGGIVRGVVELLTRQGTLRGREVSVEIDGTVPPVWGRPHALEQVLVNLVLNALDARSHGPVTVSVVAGPYVRGPGSEMRRTDAAPPPPPRRPASRRPHRPDLAVGTPGVFVVVSDRGPGVPEAERERIFDPFYTTKPPGSGTGLGLAIVQRIVDEMGGLVWVEDARGGGAAFKVFLPAGAQGGAR
jgi:two-component system, NtrC family, sensor kinase